MQEIEGIKVHCSFDALVPVNSLKPHIKNPKPHPYDQISRLAKILVYTGIRRPIRVSKLSGFVTAGHGLLLALQELDLKTAPVDYQDYENEDQEISDLIADNALQTWSQLDFGAINMEIPNLDPSFDLEWLGVKSFTIDASEKEDRRCPSCNQKIRKKMD